MSRSKAGAPYQEGSRVQWRRTERWRRHGGGVLVAGPLVVARCVPLNDGAHFRVEATRNDGTPIAVVVDRSGRDPDGLAEPLDP